MKDESLEYKELSEEQKILNQNQINEFTEKNNNQFNNINKKESDIEENFSKNRIRLLTYNFFCRPPPVNTNSDDYKDSRSKDFAEKLPNFDIICFQELFTTLNDRKHKMIHEGAKVGLKYYLSSKVPSFFSKYLVDGGLLILSRYEIVENDSYNYYINVSGDSVSKKGILYAKIKINDKYLFLFNTHLQASYFDDSQKNIDNTIQVRTKQTEELINYVYNKLLTIPREEIKYGCVVIAGDFNIDAHDNKFAKIKYKIPNYKNTEYNILKLKLSKLGTAIDLMEKKYKDHLYTFGNNEKEEYDQTLTSKADMNIRQTLDYIWEIIPDFSLDIFKSGNNKYSKSYSTDDRSFDNKKIKVLYDTLKVQEFLVKNRPYQQLSDHFGVSVDLFSPQINNNLINTYMDKGGYEEPLKDN